MDKLNGDWPDNSAPAFKLQRITLSKLANLLKRFGGRKGFKGGQGK